MSRAVLPNWNTEDQRLRFYLDCKFMEWTAKHFFTNEATPPFHEWLRAHQFFDTGGVGDENEIRGGN